MLHEAPSLVPHELPNVCGDLGISICVRDVQEVGVLLPLVLADSVEAMLHLGEDIEHLERLSEIPLLAVHLDNDHDLTAPSSPP